MKSQSTEPTPSTTGGGTKQIAILDYRNSIAVANAQKENPSIEKKLTALIVNSDESEKICIETGVIIARIEKELEAERKRNVDPLNLELKEINTFFKSFTDKLSELKESAKKKVSDYQKEKEQKRQAEQKKLDDILAKQREDELKKAAAEGKTAPAVGISLSVAPVANTIHSGTGSASGRTVWKWSVEDLSKVPEEYFILDEKKINAEVKGGTRTIAGLKIYSEKDVSFRT